MWRQRKVLFRFVKMENAITYPIKRKFSLFSPKIKPDQSSSSSSTTTSTSQRLMRIGISVVKTLVGLFVLQVTFSAGVVSEALQVRVKLDAVVEYLRINPNLSESERQERLHILHDQLTQMGIQLKSFDRPDEPLSQASQSLVDLAYLEATEGREPFQSDDEFSNEIASRNFEGTKSNTKSNNDSWSN